MTFRRPTPTGSGLKSAERHFRQQRQAYIVTGAHAPYMCIWVQLKMAADASAHGVGAAISHVLPNGEEKPITFALRMTSAESTYIY